MTKTELKSLVGKEYLKETFEILIEATALDSRLQNRVITQNASFNKHSWSSNIGTISRPEEIKEHAQVVNGLLDTIDNVPATWLKGIPFPPNLKHILEINPNNPPNKPIPAYKYLWLVVVLTVVLAGVWGISTYRSKPKDAHFPRMTINLHESDSNTKKPLKNGHLMITFAESSFYKKLPISENGQVLFDSIPIELGKETFTCQLTTKENYKLKDENQKYALAEDVNVAIEKKAVPIPDKKEVKDIPIPDKKGVKDIWIPGTWEKEQGVHVWKKGHYEKTTLQTYKDCPTKPPPGTVPDRPGEAKPGYFWQPSRWVLQDGECTWRAGSFQKKQAGQN